MPTYAYACRECGHSFDIVQSFSDDSLTVCPECGGNLRKVFNAVGVVFKGSGFYRTDSRGSSTSSESSPSSSGASTTGAASGSSSGSGASSGSTPTSSSSASSGSSTSPTSSTSSSAATPAS